LAEETEQLNARDIIRKRETENLRAIIKTRKERKRVKGWRWRPVPYFNWGIACSSCRCWGRDKGASKEKG
jgi:hypothetical protein